MRAFDEQTAKDLEFDAIRTLLLHHCQNPSAIARAHALHPMDRQKQWQKELEQTKEMLEIKREGNGFPAVGCEEIGADNERLAVRDSVLDEAGFHRLKTASLTVNDVIAALDERESSSPRLVHLASSVHHTLEIIESIDAVFDAKGQVRSNASAKLIHIREEMVRLRRAINRQFLKDLKRFKERGWLADTNEGFINNRRVLAVNSTHKRKVSGTALGQSKNGSITFIEPAANVSMNFEMEMLLDDERKEILRILRALTAQTRKHLPLFRAYHVLLVELDWIRAKMQLAVEMEADMPGLRQDCSFHLIRAYHPLLAMQNKLNGVHTEPQTIALSKKGRMLVISGPNAGGKSIALKMVGLIQSMVQSGLLVPVHPNSAFGLFKQILTDIGDNQSIENQLSTYSYRLKRMKGFLSSAGQNTLLLLDEFGTGSDPELGGALAEVFFEELYAKRSFGVITTHYANIKTRATHMAQAINGSMLFDGETLSPTYKLDLGQPGSSFTFEVAELNGIERGLLDRAKEKLDPKKVKLDGLIASLQKEKSRHARLNDRQLKAEHEAEEMRREYARKSERLDERQESVQQVGQEQNSALVKGKKLQQFIDRFKTGQGNKALIEDIRKYLSVEATKMAEKAEAAAQKKAARAGKRKNSRTKQHVDRINVGSTVRLKEGRQRGEVLEIKGKRATVAFGEFRTRVELTDLIWVR